MKKPGPIVAPGWISMPVTKRENWLSTRAGRRRPRLYIAVGGPVHPHRVQAGVAEEHLGQRGGGRIALTGDLDVAREGPLRAAEPCEQRSAVACGLV